MIEVNESNKPSPVPRVNRGEKLSAKKWNAMAEAINRPFSGVGLPRQVRRNKGSVGTGIEVQQMKVAAISGDYITCHTFNGTETGEDEITVAKPYELRRTPFDGESYNEIEYTYSDDVTREADNGSATETQVIVPPYVVGDVIYAMRNITGGTGLAVVMPDGTEEEVEWVEMNSARAWTKE